MLCREQKQLFVTTGCCTMIFSPCLNPAVYPRKGGRDEVPNPQPAKTQSKKNLPWASSL